MGENIKLMIFSNYFYLTSSMTPSGNIEKYISAGENLIFSVH